MNKRHTAFCDQLALLFANSSWHYSVLAALSIESVEHLPPDINLVIDKMLDRFDDRPSAEELVAYLRKSPLIKNWFIGRAPWPRISRYVLIPDAKPSFADPHLPTIDSLPVLAEWLQLERGELEWMADLWRTQTQEESHLNHYIYRTTQKSRGGVRVLEIPKTRIKAIQRQILREIVDLMPLHDAAKGFRKHLSCKDHAGLHVGKKFVFLFDIAHCFQSISWVRVKRLFQQLGYPNSVAAYLAGLCCHRTRWQQLPTADLGSELRNRLLRRHLPQGAPTSPGLANAAMYHFDLRVSGLAKKFGYVYSRYADDIAISSDKRWPQGYLEPLIGAIALEEGFALNFRKTRLKRQHQKQKIVGVVCNERLNVDRKEYDKLKAILTNCLRHGIDSQNRNQHTNFRAHLAGKIAHEKSLNSSRGEKLESLFARIR